MEWSKIGPTLELDQNLPTSPLRPIGPTLIVIEDKAVWDNAMNRRVERADGSVVTIKLLREFAGRVRVPKLRRARVIEVPEQVVVPKSKHVRFTIVYDDKTNTQCVNAVRKNFMDRGTDIGIKRGDWVWYATNTVALMKIAYEGIEYITLGVHFVDFVEKETGTIAVGDIDYR